VRDLENEIAVVGQQYQALRVGIKTPHGNKTRTGNLDQINDFFLGERIGHGGNVAERFVQRDIVSLGVDRNRFAIHGDDIGIGINVGSLRRDRFAVHPDAPRRDVFLRFAARRDSGGGEHSL